MTDNDIKTIRMSDCCATCKWVSKRMSGHWCLHPDRPDEEKQMEDWRHRQMVRQYNVCDDFVRKTAEDIKLWNLD